MRSRWAPYVTAMLVIQMACERAAAPVEVASMPANTGHTMHYMGSTNQFTTTVGGEEFYGDDAEGDLIPTAQIQARIQNE